MPVAGEVGVEAGAEVVEVEAEAPPLPSSSASASLESTSRTPGAGCRTHTTRTGGYRYRYSGTCGLYGAGEVRRCMSCVKDSLCHSALLRCA